MHRSPAVLLLIMLSAVSPQAARAGAPDTLVQEQVARGEYDQAVDSLKKESSLFPYNDSLRRRLADVFALIAQRELKLNHYPEASSYLAQAQELYPGNVDLILMRGVTLYLAKEYDLSRAEFTRAGESVAGLFYLGRISYDTGDLAAALSNWRRALELEPGNQAVRELLEKAERELPVESRMDKGYSSKFDVSFDAEVPSGLSAEIMDALESAYVTVGSDFGLFPSRRVPVLLYTKSDYRNITAGPDWSGGLYDGKIRLPIGSATTMTPQLRGILFHEYTHVLISEVTGNNAPTWLNEGLAEYQGRREFSPPLKELDRAVREGRLLGIGTLNGPFTAMGGKDAGIAYQQSYAMVNFLVATYGWNTVRELLKGLGEKHSPEQAFKKALADWALDLPGFLEQWKRSLAPQAKRELNMDVQGAQD